MIEMLHYATLSSSQMILPSSLSCREQTDHGRALPAFIEWCDNNHLDLNVAKTKEMVVDFRKKVHNPIASSIHGEAVEMVDSYKYLGTVFDSSLRFDKNTEHIVKRGQQRVHLMRKLSSFNVSSNILNNFYHSYIESLMTFSFICWFYGLSVKDKNSLNQIVKVCSKISGVQMEDLASVWRHRVLQKTKAILSQPNHVLHSQFMKMPSGRRYVTPQQKTNRYAKSFIPSAIKILNGK
ncbi:hypothetical protein NL108_013223 [Boleophthalmus pectinirostris]|nr:hypothetical protein NL108_013223 [Boleophthalmus pectinirostris]